MEREISTSVSKESDHGRLQQSNLTPIRQFFHSRLFPTAKMAADLHREASLLILNTEFERNGFGQTPEGLANLMRTAERKPSETAEQMRHRVYSRLYGIMWYGCKIGKGKFTGGQPTFVFPECIKKVVRAIVAENIKDYEDPVGSHVYHVTLQDLVNTKWPTTKKAKSKSKK